MILFKLYVEGVLYEIGTIKQINKKIEYLQKNDKFKGMDYFVTKVTENLEKTGEL